MHIGPKKHVFCYFYLIKLLKSLTKLDEKNKMEQFDKVDQGPCKFKILVENKTNDGQFYWDGEYNKT